LTDRNNGGIFRTELRRQQPCSSALPSPKPGPVSAVRKP
jgi:hypothetical protein